MKAQPQENIWQQRSWKPFLFVVAMGLVAFFGFRHLISNPPTWYDEGMILQLAENLALHGQMVLQLAPTNAGPADLVSAWHVSTGFPVVAPVALSFKLFGIGLWQGRVVAVIFLLLLLMAAFVVIKKIFGTNLGIWSMFLLASFSSLYGNGKNVLGEVPGLALLFIFLIFWTALEKSDYKNWKLAAWAGIFGGLTAVTKPIFLLLIPAVLITVVIRRKQIGWNGGIVAAFVAGALIPATIWFLTQFAPSQSLSQIFSFYANPYHSAQSAVSIWTNVCRFFTEATPIFTLLTFVIWFLSVIIRVRQKKTLSSTEIIALSFSTLVLVAYLRLPGWYRYFFPANIVILAFLPQAFDVISRAIFGNFSRISKITTQVILIALLVFQLYHLLFTSWIATASAGEAPLALRGNFAYFLRQSSVFVYDAPELVIFLPSQNYFQYFSAGGVWIAGEKYLTDVDRGRYDHILIDEAKVEELAPHLLRYATTTEIDRYYILHKK